MCARHYIFRYLMDGLRLPEKVIVLAATNTIVTADNRKANILHLLKA